MEGVDSAQKTKLLYLFILPAFLITDARLL